MKKKKQPVFDPWHRPYLVEINYGSFISRYFFPHHTKNEILKFFVEQKIGEAVESVSFFVTSPSKDGVILLGTTALSKGDDND
jgi:hypothetical protein